MLSSVGSTVSQLAYPLLMLAVTQSLAQAGFISAVRSCMYILLVLPAGALVDRWDRKRVMILCDLGRFFCLASIALAAIIGQLTLAQLYITGIIEVSCGTFFNIAEVSCLPNIVSQEQLSAAMGRTQASQGIMHLVGSPLGGFLFTIQRFLPFLFDATSYLISVCSLCLMHVSFQEQRTTRDGHLLQDIVEGLLWLWKEPLLRTMAFITAGNVFFGSGLTLIVILLAKEHHASDTVIGLLFSLGGLGGILGAALAENVHKRLRFAHSIFGTLWLFALLWLSMAFLPSLLLLGLIIAALFFVSSFYNITYVSYRLVLTPDAFQGRVNSVARLISNGLSPLGLALTGLLLQYAGSRITVFLAAGGQIILALLAMMSVSIWKAIFLTKLAPDKQIAC